MAFIDNQVKASLSSECSLFLLFLQFVCFLVCIHGSMRRRSDEERVDFIRLAGDFFLQWFLAGLQTIAWEAPM